MCNTLGSPRAYTTKAYLAQDINDAHVENFTPAQCGVPHPNPNTQEAERVDAGQFKVKVVSILNLRTARATKRDPASSSKTVWHRENPQYRVPKPGSSVEQQ